MKKILCFLILIFLFTGCSSNKISLNQFKEEMETFGYIVTDGYEEEEYFNGVYYAISPNEEYAIEFYELVDTSRAKILYTHNKEKIEQRNRKDEKESSSSKHAKYSVIQDEKYKVLSRIQNTLIYVEADLKYKDTIDEVLEKIGY